MKKQLLLIISLVLINQTTYGQEVTIGSQIWQTTNLDVNTYSDATVIPQVTDPTAWANLTTGAWCYYNNDPANGAIYGKLYNWYAVAGIYDAASASNPALRKKLALNGWHVPTDAEWSTLTDFLDGANVAGGKMKETGTAHWISPNQNANNSSGFTGLPGGRRWVNGTFDIIGYYGLWWSSSEDGTANALNRALSFGHGSADNSFDGNKTFGFSVRCLKDSPLSNTTFDPTGVKIYPNPVNRILNVIIDNYLINQPYTIFDILGRFVLNGKLNEVDNIINVEQLSKGVYYLKVSENNAIKFIKD